MYPITPKIIYIIQPVNESNDDKELNNEVDISLIKFKNKIKSRFSPFGQE